MESMASELTVVRQEVMKASYKVDVVERQIGDLQKQVTRLQERMNRMETLLRGLVNSQARATDLTTGRCAPNLRPTEEPRTLPDLNQPAELEMEMTRRIEDMRQSNLDSTQGIQLMSTPEGNFNSPSTGFSAVATGWGQDPLPRSSLASPTWNHQNPSQEPALVRQWPQNPKEYWSQPHSQYKARQGNTNPSNERVPSFYETIAKGPRLDFPRIDGGEPLEWIRQSEIYLAMANIPDEAKFDLARLYMGERDNRWLRRMGLFWNLPPWPDLNDIKHYLKPWNPQSFCEAYWMAKDMKKKTALKPFIPGICKYCGGKWVLGHKCKPYQQKNLRAAESDETDPVEPDQVGRSEDNVEIVSPQAEAEKQLMQISLQAVKRLMGITTYTLEKHVKMLKTVAFDVNCTDTVDQIKSKFNAIEGIDKSEQELFSAGIHLKNENSLADDNIMTNSSVDLYITDGMQISVKIPSVGKTIKLNVNKSNSVVDVKAEIKRKVRILMNKQILLYTGRQLEDNQMLSQCDLRNGQTLHVLVYPTDKLCVFVNVRGERIISLDVKCCYTVADVITRQIDARHHDNIIALRTLNGVGQRATLGADKLSVSVTALNPASRSKYIKQIIQFSVQWPDAAFHEHLYRMLIEFDLENELLGEVETSLSSTECFLLQSGNAMFTWHGNSSTSEQQQWAAEVAEFLRPRVVVKHCKEGAESSVFWLSFGGKQSYTNKKATQDTIVREPHLYAFSVRNGRLECTESKDKLKAFDIGQSKDKAEKNRATGYFENENSCQLCKVEKLNFEPPPIYCSPYCARIKRHASYYTGSTTEAHHHFCTLCYNESRSHTIDVEGIRFLKANLEKRRNYVEAEERWVQSDKCECWQHQICSLFNIRKNDGGEAEYTCHNCYVQEVKTVSGEGLQVKENELPAKVVTRPKRAFNSQSFQSNSNEDGVKPTKEPYGKCQPGRAHSLAQYQVDVWSEKCLPPGTVHLRLPRLVQVVRTFGIDFAPAMVGFNYRSGRCLPVFDGIVVCAEFKSTILEAYADIINQCGKGKMKKYDDHNCTERKFTVGGMVYLKLQPFQISAFGLKQALKLTSRFYGPLRVVQKVGNVAYKPQLPDGVGIHPVFHVSQLKKHCGPKAVPSPDLPLVTEDGKFVSRRSNLGRCGFHQRYVSGLLFANHSIMVS